MGMVTGTRSRRSPTSKPERLPVQRRRSKPDQPWALVTLHPSVPPLLRGAREAKETEPAPEGRRSSVVGRGSRGRTSRARTLKGPAALLRGGSVAASRAWTLKGPAALLRGGSVAPSRARTLKGPAALLRGGSVAPSVEGRKGPRTYVRNRSVRFDSTRPWAFFGGLARAVRTRTPRSPGGERDRPSGVNKPLERGSRRNCRRGSRRNCHHKL